MKLRLTLNLIRYQTFSFHYTVTKFIPFYFFQVNLNIEPQLHVLCKIEKIPYVHFCIVPFDTCFFLLCIDTILMKKKRTYDKEECEEGLIANL